MMRDVMDRVVLVTGGSRGIGAAIVRELDAAGTSVYFTYARDRGAAEAIVAACGGDRARVVCERNDLAESETFAGLVERTLARFGRIDALVNNAGTFAENPFDGDDFVAWRAGWRRTFEINLFGAADLAWHVMRAMRAQEPDARGVRGRIVNVVSRAAHRGEITLPITARVRRRSQTSRNRSHAAAHATASSRSRSRRVLSRPIWLLSRWPNSALTFALKFPRDAWAPQTKWRASSPS